VAKYADMTVRNPPKIELSHDRVLVCEGISDKNFLLKIMADRAIAPFDVVSASQQEVGGIDGFGKLLEGLKSLSHWSKVKNLVVAVDCDTNADANFQKVIAYLAANELPIPTSHDAIAAGTPNVRFLFLPSLGATGSLETVCFDALIEAKPELKDTIEEFITKTDANTWTQQKRDKAKVRALICSTFKFNPDISIANYFLSSKPNLFNSQSELFNPIANFLSEGFD
jgi:hypothetical protein